jgi:phosphatidylethanolamine-binding protein
LQTDLNPRVTADATNATSLNITFLTLSSNTPALTAYREPRPPAGDGPHRYTFLFFSQPVNFTIPADFASFVGPKAARSSFNFTRFVAETSLGKPVAGNFFFAENSTAADPNVATGSGNTTSRGTGAIPSGMSGIFAG